MLCSRSSDAGEQPASYFLMSRRRFQLYQSPAAPTAAAAIISHVVIALPSFHDTVCGVGWVVRADEDHALADQACVRPIIFARFDYTCRQCLSSRAHQGHIAYDL
jgi:hypothetical protein